MEEQKNSQQLISEIINYEMLISDYFKLFTIHKKMNKEELQKTHDLLKPAVEYFDGIVSKYQIQVSAYERARLLEKYKRK